MREELVSGVNEWLLAADGSDPRYKAMKALRDLVENGSDDVLELVKEVMEIPTPVARGFAFDFELTESQAESVQWTIENAPEDVKWRQVLNLLASYNSVITYGETGGPYNTSDDDNDEE